MDALLANNFNRFRLQVPLFPIPDALDIRITKVASLASEYPPRPFIIDEFVTDLV
jgi:hypothetical protein